MKKRMISLQYSRKNALQLLFGFLIPFALCGQPIGPDPAFSGDGVFPFTDGATSEDFVDVATQSDGKVVGVGHTNYDPGEISSQRIVVVRLHGDGTYDTSFGTNGKVYIDTPESSDVANAVAIQADGKILIAGQSNVPWSLSPGSTLSGGTVYRLNTNGSTDNAFGTNGRAYIDGEVCSFRNLAIQPNGRIVVSGRGFVDSRFSYMVARFLTNGQLDNAFNSIGYNEFRTSTSSTEEDEGAGFGIALQPDGKILVCGYDEKENGTAARLNVNGILDNTIGYGGILYWDFTRKVYLYSIAVQSDGKIVLAGTYDYSASLNKAVMIRILDQGNPDASFNSVGLGFYGNDFGVAYDMEIQPDGKFLLGGGDNLIRVKSDGTPDAQFDGDGYYTLQLGGLLNIGINIRLSGNRIYMAGYQIEGSDYNGFIVRLTNNLTTASEEPDAGAAVSIGPNPVADVLYVRSEGAPVTSVVMMDMRGQVLKQTHFSPTDVQTIQVSDLPPGIYTIAVQGKNFRKTFKFVKE